MAQFLIALLIAAAFGAALWTIVTTLSDDRSAIVSALSGLGVEKADALPPTYRYQVVRRARAASAPRRSVAGDEWLTVLRAAA